VRISPRTIYGATEFSNSSAQHTEIALFCHVERSETSLAIHSSAAVKKIRGFFASLRMTKVLKKNPDRNFDPGLKCYPADAV
jgi:hypothetical protein